MEKVIESCYYDCFPRSKSDHYRKRKIRSLKTDIKNIKKNQMQIWKLKNIIGINNSVDGSKAE